jgi:hypothetical protein
MIAWAVLFGELSSRGAIRIREPIAVRLQQQQWLTRA